MGSREPASPVTRADRERPFPNTPSQGPGDFVLGKIRAEGAIGIREPTTDIALETGVARHELWQHDRWCHESTHQLIGI